MNFPSSSKPARSSGSAEDEAAWLCHVPAGPAVTSEGDRPGCGQAQLPDVGFAAEPRGLARPCRTREPLGEEPWLLLLLCSRS